MTKLLLVAPAVSTAGRLVQNLTTQGFTIHRSHQLSVVLEKIQRGAYRLVLLSDELPEKVVLEILELIQAEHLAVLSLVLVKPATSVLVKLRYLETGADELMINVVGWPEFWLRLKNLLNKERIWLRPARKLADLTHYYQEGLLEGPGTQIKLRRKESKILECLTKFQHRVVGRADLMRFVWANPVDYPSSDTIDVYIRRLRLKLGKDGDRIKTYRGFGYKWEPAVEP